MSGMSVRASRWYETKPNTPTASVTIMMATGRRTTRE